ncbi:hypothetical protein [Cochleicola gelatinilyticus]|uniref:Sulfotransferase family protein n=1 Tax=Cochleicola gelatinilyticus TaxID=1763537 RepID=A0A167G8N3_9FLAO|nr:hypothetical protein [Cochleicola gelatinilyticus]OAB77334.1 hypothetical protein ULVI_12590 [Cochleicola gelatinilyticus]
MIISFKHKFIYIKTRKTAGTSIEIALSSICGDSDIITPLNDEDEQLRLRATGRSAQNFKVSLISYSFKDIIRSLKYLKRKVFYNHMPASEIKRHVDAVTWNTFYKFGFERDPIFKAISHYSYRNGKIKYTNFEDYLNSGDINKIKGTFFYTNVNGEILVDKIYKLEELELAFQDLADCFSLTDGQLKSPTIHAKKGNWEREIIPEEIRKTYGDKIKEIFAFEYSHLYR